ncbi:MAG: dUTP diphosphatase [Clostridium sp.]|nr:dUTP diphosphatase [Clostridium sp.]MCI7443243.1 dUTP diphosphatase [Clostridium sp.]
MNIHILLNQEKELIKNIAIDDTLNDYTLFARKHLQLHIKMSDLANETKCYKYWVGEIDSVNLENVFQKYISCFHQILFLGLDGDFEDLETVTAQSTDSCLSDQFLNLFIDINDSIMSSSEDHFATLVEDYLTLGSCLGFSEEQIIEGLCEYNEEVAL